MRQELALLLVVATLSGCSGTGGSVAASDAAGAAAIVDSAGIRIVTSLEPSWGAGEGWSVQPEPLVTIGVLDGPAEYQLFDVVAAGRQSDGDIVLVDAGSREVRLYDSSGQYKRTLGGPGSGPGEFVSPAQVLLTAGDSIVVWDNANFQMTRFTPAGDLASVETVDRGWIARAVQPPLYPATGKLLPDGQVLVRLIKKSASKATPEGATRNQSGALRVFPGESHVDTLAFFPDVEQVTVRGPWGSTAVAPPLARRTVTAIHPARGQVCLGEQKVPEVSCFGPDGSRILVRWEAEPGRITDGEVAAWRDAILADYTQKISTADATAFIDLVPIPAERPPYSALALDRSDNLWVLHGPTARAGTEEVRHLVFARTGALLGEVSLPPIDVLEIGDDYVLGVFRDELEIEYLRLYRLTK